MRLGAGVVVIVVCAAVLLGYACAQADDAALSYSSGMVSVLDEHATVRMATCQIGPTSTSVRARCVVSSSSSMKARPRW